MAGHDSESSKGKTTEDIDVPIFSAENMQSNMKIIYYSRTFLSIIGGVIAGILGFTGVSGFILYFVIMAITSVCLVAKTGFSVNSYFSSWNQVVLDGFLGGLMSFVLFWTMEIDLRMISCIFSEWGSFQWTNPDDEVTGVKTAIAASTLTLVFSFIEAALAAYY